MHRCTSLQYPPRLLCLGQLQRHKGFDIALRALASVAAIHPRVEMTIAGDGLDRHELEALTASLELNARVTFTGPVAPEAVPALINTATLVLIPSRVEALPQVAIQAAQMGRPVIGTTVGGIPEVVVSGETGLLVAPDDDRALATAIDGMLTDVDRTIAFGRAARVRGEALSDWDGHVAQIDAIIRAHT